MKLQSGLNLVKSKVSIVFFCPSLDVSLFEGIIVSRLGSGRFD
jgi:hypothetical protein